MYIEQFIEGHQTGNIVVDTGASTTMVNSKFVPQSAYTGREVFVIGPGKPPQHYPVAKVHLKAGFLYEIREIVVDGDS